MPLTELDPVTALVVIDLQRGIVARPTVHPMASVVANAVALARAFRAHGLPVVLVNVAGVPSGRTDVRRTFEFPPGWTELIPELEAAPSDILVTKYTQGAFHGTGLDMQLRRRRATQIVLCGVSTGAGVEGTARAAFEHGYHVTLAADAMTDTSPEAHAHAVGYVFPRLGEVGSTAEILARLG